MPSPVDSRPIVPIAVVIPAYNIETFIAETLASVFAQTVRPSEVIVINDGSTDRTAEIARENGAVVYDQENRGLPAARNAGLAKAAAQWIAYVDGDDLWAPDKLERQWKAATANPECGFVFCDFWQFNEHRCLNRSVIHEVHRRFETIRRRDLSQGIWRCDAGDLCDLLPRECVMVPSTWLIRRDLLVSIGGCDETLKYSEDIELELRLLAKTDALFVDAPLVGYRRHSSAMTSNRLRMRSGDVDVADRVIAYPSRYLTSTVAWYRRERPMTMLKAGRMAVAYGDQALARRWLLESWRAHKHPLTFGWLLLSHLVNNAVGRTIMASIRRGWFSYRMNNAKLRIKTIRAR